MVTIQATYEGDLCCTAVHEPSQHTIQTDAPKDNMGLGRYFSPTDLVATAVATCILTTLGIVAKRRGIDLKGARATADKHMNAEPRRIGRLPVDVTVEGTYSHKEKLILERAAHTCPVHKSLHPDIDAPITFRWAG